MDAYAVDEKGKLYNIEIQKDNKGATGKRARYNGSLMDLDFLKNVAKYATIFFVYVLLWKHYEKYESTFWEKALKADIAI